MDRNSKILVIVVVVVFAAFCVTAGVLGANNSNKQVQTPVSNTPLVTNTPAAENTPSSDNSDTASVDVAMTPDEAMQIVNKELSPYYKATSAYLTSGSPNPVYVVHIIHTDPDHSDYGEDGGNVTVDTVTKFVYHKGI